MGKIRRFDRAGGTHELENVQVNDGKESSSQFVIPYRL